MGRLLYHGENLNSVPNDANLVKMNDGTNVEDSIESVKNALSTFEGTVSDAYSSTKAYSKNDYCIYNNQLWKCKVACSGQTPTENTYWTKTNVAKNLMGFPNFGNVLVYQESLSNTTKTYVATCDCWVVYSVYGNGPSGIGSVFINDTICVAYAYNTVGASATNGIVPLRKGDKITMTDGYGGTTSAHYSVYSA